MGLTISAGDIALNHAQMSALKRPQEGDHLSLFNFIVSRKHLDDQYKDFVYNKDDFFCVIDSQENYFEGQMQAILRKSPSAWIKVSKISNQHRCDGLHLRWSQDNTTQRNLSRQRVISRRVQTRQ